MNSGLNAGIFEMKGQGLACPKRPVTSRCELAHKAWGVVEARPRKWPKPLGQYNQMIGQLIFLARGGHFGFQVRTAGFNAGDKAL